MYVPSAPGSHTFPGHSRLGSLGEPAALRAVPPEQRCLAAGPQQNAL